MPIGPSPNDLDRITTQLMQVVCGLLATGRYFDTANRCEMWPLKNGRQTPVVVMHAAFLLQHIHEAAEKIDNSEPLEIDDSPR